jgi:hypothetical protein
MLEISNNELLELATKDVDGVNLQNYIQNKHKDWHPIKCIEFLEQLFRDKRYNKLVASMLAVKFQRIRSNLLKQLDSLMSEGDQDILKSLDRLLQIVVKFSKLDDDDEKSDNRLIIRLADGTEEKFSKQKDNIS